MRRITSSKRNKCVLDTAQGRQKTVSVSRPRQAASSPSTRCRGPVVAYEITDGQRQSSVLQRRQAIRFARKTCGRWRTAAGVRGVRLAGQRGSHFHDLVDEKACAKASQNVTEAHAVEDTSRTRRQGVIALRSATQRPCPARYGEGDNAISVSSRERWCAAGRRISIQGRNTRQCVDTIGRRDRMGGMGDLPEARPGNGGEPPRNRAYLSYSSW